MCHAGRTTFVHRAAASLTSAPADPASPFLHPSFSSFRPAAPSGPPRRFDAPETMDLQTTIGLGLLTLLGAVIAMAGTQPENRIPYAIHITVVTSLAYIVSRLGA